MPFDLYNFQPEPPDLRCGQDIHITYAECQQAVIPMACGMICLWCHKRVTDAEWQAMDPAPMRVKGGVA